MDPAYAARWYLALAARDEVNGTSEAVAFARDYEDSATEADFDAYLNAIEASYAEAA
jgi:hypothetical protein